MNIMPKEPEISVVIPFFNENETISEIINKSLQFSDIVIAVDDGSTDNSRRQISPDKKLILLTNEINEGKGYSVTRGMLKSIELKSDITITIDADLQHPPEYIPLLIEKLGKFDIVIGNRMKNLKSMPLLRILSNKLTSFILSFKIKQFIADSQCGFRAYKTAILKDILPSAKGYEAETEILIRAGRKHYKIGFTEIPTIYGREKSKMKSFATIKGFLKLMFT